MFQLSHPYAFQLPQLPQLLDQRNAAAALGCKRAKFFADVREGLITKPVRLGTRTVRWLASDIERILRARISGAKNPDVRELVSTLEAERQAALQGDMLVN